MSNLGDHPPFELDGSGNVITKPITGWTAAPIAGSAILLAIRYVESPEELHAGAGKAIQFVLTAAGALSLSESLRNQAQDLLADKSHQGRPLN